MSVALYVLLGKVRPVDLTPQKYLPNRDRACLPSVVPIFKQFAFVAFDLMPLVAAVGTFEDAPRKAASFKFGARKGEIAKFQHDELL